MEDKARLDALEEMEEKLKLMEESIHKDDEISTLDAMEEQLKYLESSLEKIRADYDPNLDGKIKLEFANEKTEAYITITPPKIGGKRVTFDDVWKLIKEENIKNVDEQAIKRAIKYHEFHKRILIAKGRPLEYTGKDAYYAYQYGKVEEVEEGELEKISEFEEVLPGQLIFYKVPPTYGKGGISVTGEEIPPKPGKDINVVAGHNVIISEDGTRGYALHKGYVSWEGDTVSIEKIKEIEGNADFMVGDIDFKGKVHIYGSVSDGITIKATGNIKIEGRVEDANLDSGGNIYVKQSIVGITAKELRAKGNIFAESLECLDIKADGNVIVSKNIIKCNIIANKVIVTESGSRIVGGKIVAREIEAANIGSKEKEETILNIQEKVSVSEKIYPSVKLTIENIDYPLSNEEENISIITKEGKVEIIEYQEIPPTEEPIHYVKTEQVDISEIVPFVDLEVSSLAEAKEKGSLYLNIEKDKVKVQELKKKINEDGTTIYKLRVFSKDVSEPYPWEKEDEIEVEPVDGYFRLIPANEGLYLSVYPPEGKGKKVEEEEVLKEIKEKEYEEINFQLVSETVKRATGTPVIIGPRQVSEIDGTVIVNVSDDFKKAIITITPPQKGGNFVKYDDVIRALKKKGVVALINDQLIKDTIREGKFNTPILVAEEKPAVAGPNAEIDILIRTDTSKVVLIEDDHGRVDFKEQSNIENVTKGQLLAIKKPIENPGTPGMKITGEEIPPPPGIEVKLPAGKNTEVSEDESELYASIDGQAIYINEKINVEPIYEVKGDVNMVTGNIDFLGTVIISGNVLDGFKVKAEGDIQVNGVVEGATLSAGANININGGILGKDKANLFAEGNIVTKFVENAHLIAKGDIVVGEFVLHSYLDAGKSITVTEGKKGSIIGGKVRAVEGINARVIGCSISTKTIAEVGISPRVREQLINLEKMYQEDNKKFERIKLDIVTLKNIQRDKGILPPEKEQLLIKLTKLQNLLTMKLRSYAERREILEAQIARSDKGTINVIDTIYPGSIITIRAATKEIKEINNRVTYFFENNEVNERPFEESKS